MPHYSVAITKDKLSSLIDKALAGEEVIITRHGRPTVTLRAVEGVAPIRLKAREAMERLAQLRATGPTIGHSSVDLIRQMRDEGIG